MEMKIFDEATFCLDDKLDSRVVVGAGERTLRPGYVCEHVHHRVFQGVLFMILWQDLQK